MRFPPAADPATAAAPDAETAASGDADDAPPPPPPKKKSFFARTLSRVSMRAPASRKTAAETAAESPSAELAAEVAQLPRTRASVAEMKRQLLDVAAHVRRVEALLAAREAQAGIGKRPAPPPEKEMSLPAELLDLL